MVYHVTNQNGQVKMLFCRIESVFCLALGPMLIGANSLFSKEGRGSQYFDSSAIQRFETFCA